MEDSRYATGVRDERFGTDSRDWLFALALIVAVLVAYHPVWGAGFIWDDDKYVTQNPLLTGHDSLRRIWFSLDSPSQYFPLTYTSFYLERALWALNPAGYHRVNLLLHAINALLVWRLLARLRAPGAWLAAAVFALHPVQVESVAWITERKNLLMAFFFLLSLLAWTKLVDENIKSPRKHYALSLVFYALALLSKTTACTLPAALLLILWLKKMPIDRRRLLQVAPFVAMGLGMGLVTIWWERNRIGTHGTMFAIGPLDRILIASRAFWFYLGKLLWPVNLTFSYPRWTISASNPVGYIWLAATGALAGVIWRARKWLGRGPEVSILFFAATLAPVLGFIMLATFLYSFVADHYQYLACIGPIALAAAGIRLGLCRNGAQIPFLQPGFRAVLLGVLGALTWQQCGMYANEESLWRATIARNPGSWMAENNLGLILIHRGEGDEAIAHFRKSLELNPDNAKAHDNLANSLALTGNMTEAIEQFRKALEIDPRDPGAHFNLGNVLAAKGDVADAIAQFREVIKLDPDNPWALNGLAWWLSTSSDAALRNGAEAVALTKKAIQVVGGNNPMMLHTLAAAYAETGSYSEARDAAHLAEHLALDRMDVALAKKLQQEIQLYESNMPLRQTQ